MPYKKVPCNKCGKLIQAIYNRNDFNHSGLCRECFNENRNSEKIKRWLATGITGTSITTTIRTPFREYIDNEQHGLCAICGQVKKWNGKDLHFVLDHIDGNASNNHRENLRLICPNCDSQLPTFKSRNKKSARSFRNI